MQRSSHDPYTQLNSNEEDGKFTLPARKALYSSVLPTNRLSNQTLHRSQHKAICQLLSLTKAPTAQKEV